MLNVIPLGNEASKTLTDIRFIFRLDYLLHFAMMLVFAIIWLIGKNRNESWFANKRTLIYCAVLNFNRLWSGAYPVNTALEGFQSHGHAFQSYRSWLGSSDDIDCVLY